MALSLYHYLGSMTLHFSNLLKKILLCLFSNELSLLLQLKDLPLYLLLFFLNLLFCLKMTIYYVT
jgi:hypothetical protein